MDVLLVHETLAPLLLISKPQASLLIIEAFATIDLGLSVPLSSSLLPSQVGWVTLHQLSYLKTEAHDDKERVVTCPIPFSDMHIFSGLVVVSKDPAGLTFIS